MNPLPLAEDAAEALTLQSKRECEAWASRFTRDKADHPNRAWESQAEKVNAAAGMGVSGVASWTTRDEVGAMSGVCLNRWKNVLEADKPRTRKISGELVAGFSCKAIGTLICC